MKLVHDDYDKPVSLEDFLKLGEEQATQFDFSTQGPEADRCLLINEIYRYIFPWYDGKLEAGDTLSTYRTAIRVFYGHNYRFLGRKSQKEILAIVRKYTPHGERQVFEVEQVDKRGKSYYQICNNYQLGNFGIMPIRGGINPKRAGSPYSDFFDKYLELVSASYAGNLTVVDGLSEAIQKQKEYFESFHNMDDFVDRNMLTDFFVKTGSSYEVIPLSKKKSFEEYVRVATKIISLRGKCMWRKLQMAN